MVYNSPLASVLRSGCLGTPLRSSLITGAPSITVVYVTMDGDHGDIGSLAGYAYPDQHHGQIVSRWYADGNPVPFIDTTYCFLYAVGGGKVRWGYGPDGNPPFTRLPYPRPYNCRVIRRVDIEDDLTFASVNIKAKIYGPFSGTLCVYDSDNYSEDPDDNGTYSNGYPEPQSYNSAPYQNSVIPRSFEYVSRGYDETLEIESTIFPDLGPSIVMFWFGMAPTDFSWYRAASLDPMPINTDINAL